MGLAGCLVAQHLVVVGGGGVVGVGAEGQGEKGGPASEAWGVVMELSHSTALFYFPGNRTLTWYTFCSMLFTGGKVSLTAAARRGRLPPTSAGGRGVASAVQPVSRSYAAQHSKGAHEHPSSSTV